MSKPEPLAVPNAAPPKGPYSPAVRCGQLLFASGQGARVPETNVLAGADIGAQTEQCLENVGIILRAAGSDFQHVIRCGVFLVDMGHFEAMNAVYARRFGDHRPARTTVAVSALPTPGLLVEIDCVAYVP